MVTQGKSMLEGIRVIEWAGHFAAPEMGKFLGELGADVIKVERRLTGDITRGSVRSHGASGVLPGGLTVGYETHNRSKRGITLDLEKSEGKEVMYRLVEQSDVFITNARHKVIVNLGMTYDILRSYNSRLIYLRVSGYGPNGPDSDLPGNDPVILARSGIMMLEKRPDDEPSDSGRNDLADQGTGGMGICGILGALYARERFGFGQEIDVSLLGTLTWLLMGAVSYQCMTGQTHQYLDRRTARNPLSNRYKASDGKWFQLSASRSDPVWPRFCRAVGIEQYEKDPRFHSQEKREGNSEELIAILDRVFAQRPRAKWLQIFAECDLLGQGVNTLEDLITDPQIVENQYIVNYDHPVLGSIKGLGCPAQFSQTPARIVSAAPQLGQHTVEVLLSLGYSEEDIAQLYEKEVI